MFNVQCSFIVFVSLKVLHQILHEQTRLNRPFYRYFVDIHKPQCSYLNCQMACWCLEVVHMYLCGSAVIRSNHVNDSRRSYQSVKFLVTLANKCPVAKDYLLQSSTKWQWAVNWLKTKVSSSLNTFPPIHSLFWWEHNLCANVLCHFNKNLIKFLCKLCMFYISIPSNLC